LLGGKALFNCDYDGDQKKLEGLSKEIYNTKGVFDHVYTYLCSPYSSEEARYLPVELKREIALKAFCKHAPVFESIPDFLLLEKWDGYVKLRMLKVENKST